MVEKQLLELKNASMFFKTFRKTNSHINNINLKINEGEKVCFIGKNGAGKTTLLKMLLKMVHLKNGELIAADNVFDGEQVNFLFQENHLPSYLKVKHIMQLIKKNEKNSKIFQQLYKDMDIEYIMDLKISKLSGGEKQKIAILQALVTMPKILVLDEFTNNLDYPSIQLIRKIILDFIEKRNITLLISSHKKEEMFNLCNRVVILQEGMIIKEIKQDKSFSKDQMKEILENQGFQDA